MIQSHDLQTSARCDKTFARDETELLDSARRLLLRWTYVKTVGIFYQSRQTREIKKIPFKVFKGYIRSAEVIKQAYKATLKLDKKVSNGLQNHPDRKALKKKV